MSPLPGSQNGALETDFCDRTSCFHPAGRVCTHPPEVCAPEALNAYSYWYPYMRAHAHTALGPLYFGHAVPTAWSALPPPTFLGSLYHSARKVGRRDEKACTRHSHSISSSPTLWDWITASITPRLCFIATPTSLLTSMVTSSKELLQNKHH